MKVFISSTVYDLIDVRIELFAFLSKLGYQVLLSDIGQSGFEYLPDRSSIEMCLENVRRSDYFVLILDRRYGPLLDGVGYDPIAATHLEYREAVAKGIPILVFVRDRTSSEYAVYRKQKGTFNGVWVDEKNSQLFQLLEEHAKLRKADDNNWFFPFSASTDLKEKLHAALKKPLLKETLPERISSGLIPLLSVQQNVEPLQSRQVKVLVSIKNFTKAAAFIQSLTWDTGTVIPDPLPILMPGEEIQLGYVWHIQAAQPTTESELALEYASYDGLRVLQKFKSFVEYRRDNSLRSRLEPLKREFRIGIPVALSIEES